MNNFNFDWDDVWQSLAIFGVAAGMILLGMVLTADKQIRYYYLDSSGGELKIVPDIDWCDDSSHAIQLDRNISYDEALNMVNRMNNELKEIKK